MKRSNANTKQAPGAAILLFAIRGIAAGLILTGCGSGASNNNTADNPGVAGGSSSAQYNTYIGTQSVAWSLTDVPVAGSFAYGGVWAMAIDDATKYFSYQNVGHQGSYNYDNQPDSVLPPIGATLGNLTGNGFLMMTANGSTTPGSAGYALEIPGQAVIFRPGDDTRPIVSGVETSGCLALNGTKTYQFISLGTTDDLQAHPVVAYGSVQAVGSGVSWSFTNLNMYGFDGTSLQPAQLPAAGCGETAEGFAISIAPATATNNLQVTAQISSNGYFMMDQGQGDPTLFDVAPGPTGPVGLVGFQQPSSQVSTSDVVGAQYLGFEYNPVFETIGYTGSFPVAFGVTGQPTGSGTVLSGGDFQNDDVTQMPSSDITINLGQQDAQNNGLYPSVSVTLPDTHNLCVGQTYGGTDANGNPTCTFTGAAIVGNPGGKYAIYVTVNDIGLVNDQITSTHLTPYGAVDVFLYQR